MEKNPKPTKWKLMFYLIKSMFIDFHPIRNRVNTVFICCPIQVIRIATSAPWIAFFKFIPFQQMLSGIKHSTTTTTTSSIY